MKNHKLPPLLRLLIALTLGLVISILALKAPSVFGVTEASPPWLSAFVTHSLMCTLSILTVILLAKRRRKDYGFTRGRFQLTGRIFLWILPTAALSVMGFLASRSGAEIKPGLGVSPIQTIVFVWIYATVAEEIFTRGLLQSYLLPLTRYGINLSQKLRLSLPVLFSGLYFGMMHIVAVDKMGPPVILLATLLGIVAGYYREKTESLIPAMIIHALFNIGGSLPMWVLSWLL